MSRFRFSFLVATCFLCVAALSTATSPVGAAEKLKVLIIDGQNNHEWQKTTPLLDQMLGDLALALEQDEGQRLGGKSAEASRFILRAIDRMLDDL